MSSDIESAFVQELLAAAESAVQPTPADIYAGAVQRGRRIRRTAIIKRTLAGVAALGVVAAVGVPLLSGGTRTTEVGAAAAPTVKIKTTPTADDTKQAAAAQAGTAWMPSYMEQTLKSLLPAGSNTSVKDNMGDTGRVQASAPTLVNLKGTWGGRVQTGLATSTGTSAVVLNTSMDSYQVHCPTAAEAPHENCTKTSVNGGTLIVDLGFKNPINGEGATIWDVYWYGPSGQSVHLDEVTDASHSATQAAPQALTPQQMTAIVQAPVWDRVGQSLPAPCTFGVMAGTADAPTAIPGTIGLVCATSRAVAIPGNGESGIVIAG
jgi:hypothetical protein